MTSTTNQTTLLTLSQMGNSHPAPTASSTSQPSCGSVFVEGHDLSINVETFLADRDQLTAFFLGLADPRDSPRTAKHVNASRAATEAGHYSARFSASERGHALRQKPRLTSLPLNPTTSSSASFASACPSLVSIDSDVSSRGDPVMPTSHHDLLDLLALRLAMWGPSTAKTRDVSQVGSWSVPAPAPKVAEAKVATAVGVDIDRSDPPIFESIRQVLRDNPAYAEHIIRAVQHLPDEKQVVLLGAHGESIVASGLVDDDGNESDTTVQTSRSATAGRSSKSNSNKTKKRKASQGRDGNSGDGGGSGDGSGGGSGGGGSGHGNPGRPKDKRQKKSGKHYACPYCLAFPIAIANNPNFQSCRTAVYRKTRNDLRQHLDRSHSPNANAKAEAKAKAKAKADDPNPQDDAQYYMTDKQWNDVRDKIDNAGKKHYALNSKEWLDNELKCLLAIWDVIFPVAQFPSLSKPTSPFVSDDTERPSLAQQGKVMFEAIYAARAQKAVQARRITSVDQYQPFHGEYMEMMSQSFAIVINMDSALSARIVNTPTDDLRDAATIAAGAADDAIGGVPNTGTANASPPSDVTMPGTLAPSPGASTVPPPTQSLPAATPGPGSTINFQLECPLTDIHIRVATAPHDPGQQHRTVQVIIPPGAVPRSFDQKPVDQEPVNQQSVNQQLFNMPLFNHQPFTQHPVNYFENMFMAQGPQMALNGSALQPSGIGARQLGDFGSGLMQLNGAIATPSTPATNQPMMPNFQHTHVHDLNELQGLQLLKNATQEPRATA